MGKEGGGGYDTIEGYVMVSRIGEVLKKEIMNMSIQPWRG